MIAMPNPTGRATCPAAVATMRRLAPASIGPNFARSASRRRAFSTSTIDPSTISPKSSAPRLMRLPETPRVNMPVLVTRKARGITPATISAARQLPMTTRRTIATSNHAATSILGGKPDRVGKLGHGDTGGIEARDIGLDQILRFVAAIGVDFGDTLDLPKHRAHNILLGLVELHQLVLLVHAHRRMRPFERVIIDFAQTGGDRRKLRRGSHRQLATHPRQSFGDKLPRLQLVGALLVDQGDL